MPNNNPTKADLITLLVGQGRGTHVSLKRLTLAGLQAMADEVVEQPETVNEPTAAPLAGELTLGAEEVLAGDSYLGIEILEVQAATKWVYFRSEAGWFFQIFRGTPVPVSRAA